MKIKNISKQSIYVAGRNAPLQPGEEHDVPPNEEAEIEKQLDREDRPGNVRYLEVVDGFEAPEPEPKLT
jgi:hypothetical protein